MVDKSAKITAFPDEDMFKIVIDTSMNLIATNGFRALALADIAQHTGLDWVWLYNNFSSKYAILRAFYRQIDHDMLRALVPPTNSVSENSSQTEAAEETLIETTRDQLFEIIMHRFDALTPYKAALIRLAWEGRRTPDPMLLAQQVRSLSRSMDWILEAAGAGGRSGPLRLLRRVALSACYEATLYNWLRDDSPDLSRTMAHLDQRLQCLERVEQSRSTGLSRLCSWFSSKERQFRKAWPDAHNPEAVPPAVG